MSAIIDTTDLKKTQAFFENVTDLLIAQKELIDTIIFDHTQNKPSQNSSHQKSFFGLSAPLQKIWGHAEKIWSKKTRLEPAVISITLPKPEENIVDQKFGKLGFTTNNWSQRLDANYTIYCNFHSLSINRKKGFPKVKDQHIDLFLANIEFIEDYQKMIERTKLNSDFKINLRPIAKDYEREIDRISNKIPRLSKEKLSA